MAPAKRRIPTETKTTVRMVVRLSIVEWEICVEYGEEAEEKTEEKVGDINPIRVW